MPNFRCCYWPLALAALLATLGGCDSASVDGVTEASGALALDNPALAGSRLPRLSSDPGGTLVLSWVEPAGNGHRLLFSVIQGDTWTPPVVVTQGDRWFVNWADFPSVQPLSDGLWAAHWLVRRPGGAYAYDVALALSQDGGESWGEAFTPHRDGTATEHGFVSLWPAALPQGGTGVGVLWLDGRDTAANPAEASAAVRGTSLRAATFDSVGARRSTVEIDPLVCDCCQTSLALAPGGPVVAYRDRTEREERDIRLARWRDGGWVAGMPVAPDGWIITGCPVNGPAIAARGSDMALGWYTEAGGRGRVQATLWQPETATWSEPVVLDDSGPLGRVDVEIAVDGVVAVSWLGAEVNGRSPILVARVDAAGRRPVPVPVASVDASRAAGFPQIASHGGDLVVAWTTWRAGQPRVMTALLPLSALPQ